MNKKINLIQKFLIKNNFSFYLVTNSDIHLNESPNLEQKDIFNLTGFDCSNGYLIILRKNILFSLLVGVGHGFCGVMILLYSF